MTTTNSIQILTRHTSAELLRIPAIVLAANLAAAALVQTSDMLTVEPAHPLPAFDKKLVWDAQGLPYDSENLAAQKDMWGAFVMADFNHDGRLDIARVEGPTYYPANGELELGVALQQADGSFLRKATIPINTSMTWRLLAADVNEDGHMDLLAEDSGNDLVLLLGKGDGTFQPARSLGISAATQPVLAHFNADSHLDLVAGKAGDGTVQVFSGRGDGPFVPGTTLSSALWFAGPDFAAGQIMVQDVNHDGKPDIVVAAPTQAGPSWTGNLDVYLGQGDGTFQGPVTTSNVAAWQGVLGDFNGDGIPDYAGVRYSPQLEIWLGKADGHFAKAVNYALPVPPGFVNVVDLNHDGIPDLVINGQTSPAPNIDAAEFTILLGKGDGTFLPFQTLARYPNALAPNNSIQIVDFNGDGLPDLAAVSVPAGPNGGQAYGLTVAVNRGAIANPQSGFLVTVSGEAGQQRRLEMSSDLVSWTPVATNASLRGPWTILEPTVTTPAERFYRTVGPAQ